MRRKLAAVLVPLLGAALACADDRDARAPGAVGYRVLDLPLGEGAGATTLTVAVWYPTAAPPAPHVYGGPTRGSVAVGAAPLASGRAPLLVFSHGYGGSGLGHVFLAEPLAARGWIVAAPDHHDRHSAVRIREGALASFDRVALLRHAKEISRKGPEDREEYAYRFTELEAALRGVLAHETFGPLVDPERIALGGHSFGGFTALGLAGAVPGRHDPRVKALLLFSSGASGYLFREPELAAVRVPSAYFLGEAEKEDARGERSMAELADKVYGNLPAPKYLFEVKGANHFSFNDGFTDRAAWLKLCGTPDQHDVTRTYAVAFLEAHVAGKEEARAALARPDPRLSAVRRAPPPRAP